MLTEYIRAAMEKANYSILEDGSFLGTIPPLRGVIANAATLEACRKELQSVLEDWLLVSLVHHDPIPVIDGINLSLSEEAA